jgi:uncharacterized protein
MHRTSRVAFTYVSVHAFRMSSSASAPTASAPLQAVRCTDRPDSLTVRKATREAHLLWAAASDVVFAGPLLEKDAGSPKGSLLVMRGEAAVVAERLTADPYTTAGLFDNIEQRAWICGMKSDNLDTAMPLFCVWCVDCDGKKTLRKETRPAHLAWWKESGRKGAIGPFPAPDGDGAVGTMIVCEGKDLGEVTEWAATDPYVKAELFDRVHVFPMNKTIDSMFL